MYSLNVPVPGTVKRLVWDLRTELLEFDRLRDELTLVVKRLEARSAGAFAADERAVRQALTGTDPFDVTVEGIDVFADPPAGPSPVVYLAVDSPTLTALHARLVDRFGAVDDIEGDNYVPHITVARGLDDLALLESVREIPVGPHHWTVERLLFWDARHELPAGDVSLPA